MQNKYGERKKTHTTCLDIYVIQRIVTNCSIVESLHGLNLACQSSDEESVLLSSLKRMEVHTWFDEEEDEGGAALGNRAWD